LWLLFPLLRYCSLLMYRNLSPSVKLYRLYFDISFHTVLLDWNINTIVF
jgi:hypothetical protein